MAIIYLEPDDEITSAAARIRGTTDARIAVVVPYGSRLATSRINFRLLAREATERGRTVEVVAPDAAARALAGSAGLVTYPTVSAFEAAVAGASPNGEAAGAGVPDVRSTARADQGSTGAAAGTAADAGGAGPRVGGSIRGPRRGAVDEATKSMPIPSPREASPAVPVVGRARPPRSRRWILGAVGLLVLGAAVAGLAAFLYLPTVTVVLAPKSEAIGPISFVVTADPTITSPDAAGLRVPARTFTFDLQASDTFPATGKNIVETKATGGVVITNCDWLHDARIPAGAVVSTAAGVAFTTDAPLRIKSASLAVFKIDCTSGSVSVTAAKPGTDGNVNPDTIKRIDGSYGVSPALLVTNPAATTGGTHTETPQVVQADVDAAVRALDAKLASDLDAKIAQPSGVPAGTRLFPETKQLGASKTTVDPATLLNQPVAQFQLGATATGSVLGVDSGPISGMAGDKLHAKVKDGWSLVTGSENVEVGDPIVAGTSITFPATARARETRTIDRTAVLAAIAGLGLPQARTVLAGYGDATLTAWPDWVTTVPTSTSRISLTIESGQGSAPSGAPGSSAASAAPPLATAAP